MKVMMLFMAFVANAALADSSTELFRIVSPSGDAQVRVVRYLKDGVKFPSDSVHIEPLISDSECKRRLGDRAARVGGFVFNGYNIVESPSFFIPTQSGYAKNNEYLGYAVAGEENVQFILNGYVHGSDRIPVVRAISDICYAPSTVHGG